MVAYAEHATDNAPAPVQVSSVEVLAPVFGTQKRGSNTGRVRS